MTKLKAIHTKNAPSAIGAYSQAVKAGGFMYVSGQIPLAPETMEIVSEDFNVQVKQVLENLKAVIVDSDSKLSDVVKLNVYLKDLGDFQSVNDAMSKVFDEPYPARAAVEVSRLPKDVLVEIDAIVYIGD
ncbi:MAG: RidA family protein [Gammaproteobacteria bacterium]|tara:strand:+ start:282 stop:671 length:390 start_codon:yes stop_codon:yes gene_type:complete